MLTKFETKSARVKGKEKNRGSHNRFHSCFHISASFKIIVTCFVIVLVRFLFIAVNKKISEKPNMQSCITLTYTFVLVDRSSARNYYLNSLLYMCLYISSVVCIILFSNDIDLSSGF